MQAGRLGDWSRYAVAAFDLARVWPPPVIKRVILRTSEHTAAVYEVGA